MLNKPALIKDLLQKELQNLTPSERRLATVLLKDYPVQGLQSITKLATDAQVSTPTVIRMARKLGFEGFPGLQSALREEVSAQIKKPMSKHEAWAVNASTEHTINRFAKTLSFNLQSSLENLDTATFDAAAAMLARPDLSIYLAGGRITRSNADYFYNHLQIIRPGVTLLSGSENVWPQYLLDMDESSVLILFDIRRYEKNLHRLASLAQDRGCQIILFTDQWGSPVSNIATHTFRALVEAPSSWDSTMVIMFYIEALIAEVQNRIGTESRERIEELETMFGMTRIFRNL